MLAVRLHDDIHIFIYMCMCMCVYTHTHTHTHIYIYIYIYIMRVLVVSNHYVVMYRNKCNIIWRVLNIYDRAIMIIMIIKKYILYIYI